MLVALALAVGCSDSAGDAAATSSASGATTTAAPSTAVSGEADVLAAYRSFWNDGYLVAADPMDPTNPALVRHATGGELQTVQKAFLARQSNGEVIRGTLDLAPRVVSVVGTTATVRDCYLDNTGVYDAATGERHDKATGVRHLVTATLVLEQGTWKVSDLHQEQDGCTAA